MHLTADPHVLLRGLDKARAPAAELIAKINRQGITVVQLGSAGDVHPRLDGVIDYVGKTSIRELFAVGFISDKSGPPTTLVMPACVKNWAGHTPKGRGVRGGFVLQ